MIGMLAIVGLNSVNAQNMGTPETNYNWWNQMTGTMDGNMTTGEYDRSEKWMAGPTNMTSP